MHNEGVRSCFVQGPTEVQTMSDPATAQPTLLFIPDISGFTRFVHETEIQHSQHIIEELLEAIIDANEIGLSVSEIEGDAVLFYRPGPAPTAAALLAQVQRMYVAFHGHLRRYDSHRICHCGACSTASGLSLKFIAHHGEVGTNIIKDHPMLFGRDVIAAHRLMKNPVESPEYVLLTHDLINACATWVEIEQAAWAQPVEGEASYDLGTVRYCSIPLEPLRAHVPEPRVEDYSLPGATRKVKSHDAIIEAPIELVFNVLSDLSVRHHWMVGLKGSDRLSSKLPQHGATHRCVMKDSEKDPFIYSHSFDVNEDYVTFTDTEPRMGWSNVFTLRRLGPSSTRMESHMFIKDMLVMRLLFRLFMMRKMEENDAKSAHRLNDYCKTLLREGRNHTSRVRLRPSSTTTSVPPVA